MIINRTNKEKCFHRSFTIQKKTAHFFQIQVILEIGEKILEMERDYFQISCIFAFEVYRDPYVIKTTNSCECGADLLKNVFLDCKKKKNPTKTFQSVKGT